MKKNFEILSHEFKATRDGTPFARIKTTQGWLSCFLKDVWDEVIKYEQFEPHLCCLEIEETKGTNKATGESITYRNIKECFGAPQEGKGIVDEPIPVVKPGFPAKVDNKFTTMYVSYAKDVFCCLSEIAIKEGSKIDNVVDQSIDVVKKFKEAFE